MADLESNAIIDNAVAELDAINLDRPYGITIKPKYAEYSGILVGNETLAFFITKKQIECGHHTIVYEPTLRKICGILSDPKATEEYFATYKGPVK